MAVNIEQQIRKALAAIFTQELQTNLSTEPRTQLFRLSLWPLQDDPTQVAPYLVYGRHPQLGRVRDSSIELVGGPTSREEAEDDIGELSTRVEMTLQKHYNLNDILAPGVLLSADGSERLTGNNAAELILGTASRIYGGDGEFYGEAKIIWRYRLQRTRNWA
jgi:hypothetical protein